MQCLNVIDLRGVVCYRGVVVQDVLWDKRIKLDDNFKNSFIGEIIKVGNRMKTPKSPPNSMRFRLMYGAVVACSLPRTSLAPYILT